MAEQTSRQLAGSAGSHEAVQQLDISDRKTDLKSGVEVSAEPEETELESGTVEDSYVGPQPSVLQRQRTPA